MAEKGLDLRDWHDWTDPEFFAKKEARSEPLVPLFLRQLLPTKTQRTRLTLTGWFLVLVSMGIGSAAYNTASNILFMTLSLLLSSLILSGILSQINFRKLKWKLRAPIHVRAHEVGVAEVQLINEKRIFPTMCIRFLVGTSADDEKVDLHLSHQLSAGQRAKLDWTFVPKKRGICEVRLSGVESQFPFGFLRKILGTETREEVVVWPGRVEYSFNLRSAGWRQRSEAAQNRAGPGSDLLNLRPYQRGDTPRSIHWKATARTGKLVVRQFAQEGLSGFHLFVSTDAEQWDERDFELMCSLAASMAEDLFHVGRLETVQIGGGDLVAIKTIRDLHEVFDELSRLERNQATANPIHTGVNRIRFRPGDSDGVAIYLDDERAGQIDY